jgi:hypothetical protein
MKGPKKMDGQRGNRPDVLLPRFHGMLMEVSDMLVMTYATWMVARMRVVAAEVVDWREQGRRRWWTGQQR